MEERNKPKLEDLESRIKTLEEFMLKLEFGIKTPEKNNPSINAILYDEGGYMNVIMETTDTKNFFKLKSEK